MMMFLILFFMVVFFVFSSFHYFMFILFLEIITVYIFYHMSLMGCSISSFLGFIFISVCVGSLILSLIMHSLRTSGTFLVFNFKL